MYHIVNMCSVEKIKLFIEYIHTLVMLFNKIFACVWLQIPIKFNVFELVFDTVSCFALKQYRPCLDNI